jgi:hypothetical protein
VLTARHEPVNGRCLGDTAEEEDRQDGGSAQLIEAGEAPGESACMTAAGGFGYGGGRSSVDGECVPDNDFNQEMMPFVIGNYNSRKRRDAKRTPMPGRPPGERNP